MESFRSFGAFWPHEKTDENALVGELVFDPVKGARLHVVGSFEDSMEMMRRDETSMLRLFGWLENQPVTLVRCFRSGGPTRSHGVSESSYVVNEIFTGAHLPEEEMKFRKGVIRTSGGSDWIGERIVSDRSSESPGNSPAPWLNYSAPPRHSADFSRGEVAVGYSWKTGNAFAVDRVEFEHWPAVSVTYTNPNDFEVVREDMGRIDDLITLCTDQVSSIRNLSLMHDDHRVTLLSGEQTEHLRDISFIAPVVDLKEWKNVNYHQMLLSYQELGGVDTIARWLDVAPTFHMSLDSLMSIKRAGKIFGENRFLNVAFAAESFHRDVYGGTSLPSNEFEELKSRCLSVAGEHSAWLGQRLQYVNEATLRDRLRSLFEKVGSNALPFVNHPNRWINVVVGTRNALTHVTSRRQHINGDDLYFLSESLYCLVRAALLNQAGVEPSRLAKKSSSYFFTWYADRLDEIIERLRRSF